MNIGGRKSRKIKDLKIRETVPSAHFTGNMIVTGPQQGYTPGYINYDDLVEGALEGVAEHRASTRQRHLR